MASFLKIARGEPLLRNQMPEVFKNIQTRDTSFERTYKNATTRINRVHRFTAEDTLIFEAEIHNTSDKAIEFNPHRLEIRIGSSQYRPALSQGSGRVAPHQTTPVYLIVASGPTGEREPIHISNEFYLTWRPQSAPSRQPSTPRKR